MPGNQLQKTPVDWTVLPARELPAHAGEWDALNLRTVDLPVLDALIFMESLSQFGDGKEKLVLGRVGKDLVAAGILIKRKPAVWATFQPSQAPLGAWLSDPAFDQVALWQSLQLALPQWCLLLGISQQDPRLMARPVDSGRIQTLDYIDTASISVTGSFADYWAGRGRNLRQNLRRQRNRLEREGIKPRLEVIVEPGKIGPAVDDYGYLESKGWKAGKGTSLHPDNAQGRFYRAILEKLAEKNNATIYRYWYNDDLVAIDLCVHRNGVLIILKTTHDEAFSKTSPTHLMRQAFFEPLFAAGEFRRIEFYGKLMDWHTKWSDDIRRMYHVNFYRWPAIAAIKAIFGHSKTNNR